MRALSVLDRAGGAAVAGLRITPTWSLGSRRALRLLERNGRVYLRMWILFVSGFFEPVFYLLSISVGISKLAGPVAGPGGLLISYTAFVAPALMAVSSMNGAVMDASFGVFFKLKFAKVYDAVLATPLGVPDIALGEIAWALKGFVSMTSSPAAAPRSTSGTFACLSVLPTRFISSSTVMPSTPRSPSLRQRSGGNSLERSISAARGAISLAAKSRTLSAVKRQVKVPEAFGRVCAGWPASSFVMIATGVSERRAAVRRER